MVCSRVNRREVFQWAGAAMAATALSRSHAATGEQKRVMFFTKSSGFEHSVIRRENGELSHAERIFVQLGKEHGVEVTATKDGSLFDEDLNRWDAFVFYTTGDLTERGTDKTPPMSKQGKQALLEAVASGKGFVGSHCASDTFHTPGKPFENQQEKDPYIAMLGGEFIRHGKQQKARMVVANPHFPGMEAAGHGFEMLEEWYSLKNFASDLHVLLINDTMGMEGKDYQRPRFPATWARRHGEGRVFYTSMGHREDVWTNPRFQSILLGGLRWALREVETDIPPNIRHVTPGADVMPPE